jgi:hypothetical protein
MSAVKYVAIQSHSSSPGGVFVRFDYRFDRDRPVILKVVEDTDETLIKVGDRLALPTDDIFFARDSRKARSDRFNAGVVTQRDLALLNQEARNTAIFSIREANPDEAENIGDLPLTAEAKEEALLRENVMLRQKLQNMEAAAINESLKGGGQTGVAEAKAEKADKSHRDDKRLPAVKD